MSIKSTGLNRVLTTDHTIRNRIRRVSGRNASVCYQCATCASVCDLSEGNNAFPRKQMQYAQLGLLDKIKADPAIWLCHQCNDCSVNCPKDARPGDVMAAMRALHISENSVIKLIGRMYENIGKWWPVAAIAPVAVWFLFYGFTCKFSGFCQTSQPFHFETLVPHWMIYVINIPMFTGALLALGISGSRAWNHWGAPDAPLGIKINAFFKSVADILLHRKMTVCTTAKHRSAAHVMVMWGFIGALATTTVIALLLMFSTQKLPLPFFHPLKLVGNAAGGLIVAGGVFALFKRWRDEKKMGRSSAFDHYFILLILAVVITGFGAQFFRMFNQQPVALTVYLLHLGLILALFISLPFSKFSHMWYRLLAVTWLHLTSVEQTVQYPKPASAFD